MSLKDLFKKNKKLPSLEGTNEKKEDKSQELTEDDLQLVNGITTQEEWEGYLKAKKEQENRDENVMRR